MYRHLSRTLAAVALTTAMLAPHATPALAAPASACGRRVAPAGLLSRMSSPLPSDVEVIQERLLPVSGRVNDNVSESGNFLDVWAVPLHKGQSFMAQLTVPVGTEMTMEIWGPDETAREPLTSFSAAGGATFTLGWETMPPYEGVPADGWYYVLLYADTGEGRYALDCEALDQTVFNHDIQRIAGLDRINTAIRVAEDTYADGADTVVLATGWNFADALAASGLCGSYDSPLLLTRPTALPPEVASEIVHLKATQVFVIGSDRAVSDAVYDALDAIPSVSVERIEGANRFETAAAIARKIKEHELTENRPFTGSAFIVNGLNFPDALSVAPYAFSRRMPILPVLQGSVPTPIRDVIAELGTTEAILVGSESVVGPAAVGQLAVASKTRVYGAGRTETAIAAAGFAVNRGWASWNRVGLATGWNFPDALGGGVNVGRSGGVMLLSAPEYMNSSTYKALLNKEPVTTKLYGSFRAIAGCVRGDADWAYSGDPADSPWVD